MPAPKKLDEDGNPIETKEVEETKPVAVNKSGRDLVSRAYTPVTAPWEDITTGECTFVMRCVDSGAFSAALRNINVNDRVHIRGPQLKLDLATDTMHHAMKIGLLAAGTGLTPLLQLAHFFLAPHAHARVPGSRLDQHTWTGTVRSAVRPPAFRVVLIYFVRNSDDVICREALETLAADHTASFVFHIVPSESPERARMSEFLKAHLPPPSSDTFVAVCGPERFHADVAAASGAGWGVGLKGSLMSQLGYQDAMVYNY